MVNKVQSVFSRSLLRVSDSMVDMSGNRIPILTGQVGQVDVVSQNGYRYVNGFWDKVLGDKIVQDSIASRDMFGMIEHPKDDDEYVKTPYEKASHIVLKAWCQDGNPYAQFGLLNNEYGNSIKALLDVGHRPGVSTRGFGNFKKDSISTYLDDSNYVLVTWDIVRSPNFSDLKMDKTSDSSRTSFSASKVSDSIMANPIFRELCEMHQLDDSVDESYNQDSLVKSMDSAIKALTEFRNQLINCK